MNTQAKLTRVRELAQSQMLKLPPLAGEEMNLPSNDPRREGFVDGERALAARILVILDQDEEEAHVPVEDEMVLGR